MATFAHSGEEHALAETAEPKIIAIDGPAGSGKSTVARAVAERLGLDHLDTGAMYRSVAFAALRVGVDPDDDDRVARLARRVDIRVDSGVVTVDGVDATIEIRGPEVSRAVSAVAANPAVRAELVRRQREWAAGRGGGVVEGRDIGTVVFPRAALKVYLTAGAEERARRRTRDSADLGYDAVAADISRRDQVDSSRGASPLTVAPDALVIDTTGRSVEQVVVEVLSKL
jgi:CMP/dCMP kinase